VCPSRHRYRRGPCALNIIVCIKAVPASVKNPTPKSDGSGIVTEGDLFMNESDDYALEQALLLKKGFGTTVTALTVGSVRYQDILHVSLAKGADQAIRIDADEFDPNIVSFILSRAIGTMKHDLILTGIESSDGMSSQIGISVGAQLKLPYVYAVTKLECGDTQDSLSVTRELGSGRYQTLEVTKPALLCVQSGIVPLTYTPVVKLIHARRKAIPCLSLSELGITDEALSLRRKAKVVEVRPSEKNNATVWLSGNPEQLAVEIIDKIAKAL